MDKGAAKAEGGTPAPRGVYYASTSTGEGNYRTASWLRGTVVERQSLTGKLSLSHSWHHGCPIMNTRQLPLHN